MEQPTSKPPRLSRFEHLSVKTVHLGLQPCELCHQYIPLPALVLGEKRGVFLLLACIRSVVVLAYCCCQAGGLALVVWQLLRSPRWTDRCRPDWHVAPVLTALALLVYTVPALLPHGGALSSAPRAR